MLNKAKIALAAAMILGSASVVFAGEGSADLSYPPGYDLTHSAPQHQSRAHVRSRDNARDAYGFAGDRSETYRRNDRAPSDAYMQHGNGGIDSN